MQGRRKMKKNKIGIMGGTFNPIHNAHLKLAECAMNQYTLDGVIFIPDNIAYHKRETDMVPADIRLEMTRLAVSDNSRFSVSDIDIKRKGYTYTYETLSELKQKMPDSELYFILGADSLMYFDSWKNPDIIASECIILAAVRDMSERSDMEDKIAEIKKKFDCDIRIVNFEKMDISSTEIRTKLRNGDIQWCRSRVPKRTFDYIISKKIYMCQK